MSNTNATTNPVKCVRSSRSRRRRPVRFCKTDINFRLVAKVNDLNHRAHDLRDIDPERSKRLFAAKVALLRYLLSQGLATGMVSVIAENGWQWHIPLDVLIRAITEIRYVR